MTEPDTGKKVILITSEFFGRGDDELGRILMASFFRKLSVEENRPDKIIFVNSGVKLLSENSPAPDGIDLLKKAGITLAACGTCVKHYGLEESIDSSYLSDMRSTISALMSSDNAVTI